MPRRNEWRRWPRRRAAEVHNHTRERKVYFVLECGHVIEKGYYDTGWPPGITNLRGRSEYRIGFACGHCHHGAPRGSVAPDTGRCAFFESYGERQLWLPGVE